MWRTSFIVLFVTLAVCVTGDRKICPYRKCKYSCNTYVTDDEGCPTCECKDLCKDVICGQGRVCKEFKIHFNNSFVFKCVDPSLPLDCQYPPDPSGCEAAMKKWYYDRDMDTCREFTYGGCLGNANNFGTRFECAAKCIDRDTRKLCPQVMCAMYCEHGFQKNEDGCDICKCREQPEDIKCDNNSVPECTRDCPNGYLHRKDHKGCPTCECRMPDQCPKVQCRMFCQFGFTRDLNGCEICQCMENPCKNRVCSLGEVCEMVPICTPDTHNGCHYFAKCSASYTINRIRVQLTFEHQKANKETNCKNLLPTFVTKVKERMLEVIESPDADITFIEASPENDILHVTLHITKEGEPHIVPMWNSVQDKMKDNLESFIIIYHGHTFIPRRESLVTSYFSKAHPQPRTRTSFFNIITIMACAIGVSIVAFIFVIKARTLKKPPQSKRINIIYRPAPDEKPLV